MCWGSVLPKPCLGPPIGLSTNESSAMLYLWIIERIGLRLMLWTAGSCMFVALVVLSSLNPSSAMFALVSYLGRRL